MPSISLDQASLSHAEFWRRVHYAMQHGLNVVMYSEETLKLSKVLRRYAGRNGIACLVKRVPGAVVVAFV